MAKERLDMVLVERGLAESRSQAQRLIMAGQVRVNGQVVWKPATGVDSSAPLEIDRGPRYVSRGGEKLEAALLAFQPLVAGQVCADVGASTGGFTDCLLQHGAQRVYAIDVGQGILDWKLRQDPRVVVMEGSNARYIERLPEPVSLVTIDASFISLKTLLPVVLGWFGTGAGAASTGDKVSGLAQPVEVIAGDVIAGDVLALIKPQFEAGRQVVAKGKGVVRDPAVHRQVLEEVLAAARQAGYGPRGLIRSPLLGPKGNVEFLVYLKYPRSQGPEVPIQYPE